MDDIPTIGEFDTNTWMKSNADRTRRSAVYSFCQQVISDHVDMSTCMCGDISSSNDGVLNYANEVMSLGMLYFNYPARMRKG